MALNEIPFGGEIRSQPLNENFQYLDQKLVDNFNNLNQRLDDVQQELDAHLAETVSEQRAVVRDLTLTGVQTIACSRKPKQIQICAGVNVSKKISIGSWAENNIQRCVYTDASTGNFLTTNRTVAFADTGADRTYGEVTNVSNGSFDISWTKQGNGATGSAQLFITIFYHGSDI